LLDSQHKYRLIIGTSTSSTRPLLILLHGSGQDEQDMVPLAAELSPQSTAIAVRGAIPWEEGYAFFRRFADRSIDERSILTQVPILAEFMVAVRARYSLRERPILCRLFEWRNHGGGADLNLCGPGRWSGPSPSALPVPDAGQHASSRHPCAHHRW
jgi:hypothetical protein